ncbi:MAG: class I SAM-dependent rRNA methyltransferase [Myxococcota bacterium]
MSDGPSRASKNKRRSRTPKRSRSAGRSPDRGQPSSVERGVLVVNGYSEQWLRRGFPWVYDEEVERKHAAIAPGDTVQIRARDGTVLGTGVYDLGRIAVRRFREDAGPIDVELFTGRIRAAHARRRLPPRTSAWRLVHGENDDLPGVRIEMWNDVAVITLDSPALLGIHADLIEALRRVMDLSAAWLHWRPGDEGDRRFDDLPTGLVWGEAALEALTVQELGLSYRVLPAAGHDIGLFCDMRALRAWMTPHWAGRRVLNTFCFTGAFSVAAVAHGAREVVSVDLSGPILERVRANFEANHLDPKPHPIWQEDTFKALDRLRRKGERFDVIIADPPSFSHGPAGTWSVQKDYRRLVSACLRVLAPGGWLIAATNLGSISPREFKGYLIDGAERAGRRLRLIHDASTPMDFPAALHFPESRYLKCWVLEG